MAEIIEISDLSTPELRAYSHLTEAELRAAEYGLFIAEGDKVIGHALDAGCVPVSLLMERRHAKGKAQEIIERSKVPVYTASAEVLEKLTGYRLTRGILCAMRRPAIQRAEDICTGARRAAYLDGISDSTNIGAIFRSAAALNVDAVLLSRACCDPLTRRAIRVSMGTVFQVKWAYLSGGIDSIRDMGFTTVAMALTDKSVSIDDKRLIAENRLAIVLGAEGDGLRSAVIEKCDFTARIPMAHGVDSLNVASASAVAFWELRVRG